MNNNNVLWILLASLSLVMGPGTSHAYEVGNVQTGGSIHGRVSFLGSPPEPLHFKVEKNPEVCGQERSLVKVESRDGFLTGCSGRAGGRQYGKTFLSKNLHGKFTGRGCISIPGRGIPRASSQDQRL